MQAELFASLLKALFDSRLASYRHDDHGGSQLTPYSRYLWNSALSESLYCVLQGLEVTLRDSIHDSITRYLGEEDWFHTILKEPGEKLYEEVKERLESQNKPLDIGQVVAGFSFGLDCSIALTRLPSGLSYWEMFSRICQDEYENAKRFHAVSIWC